MNSQKFKSPFNPVYSGHVQAAGTSGQVVASGAIGHIFNAHLHRLEDQGTIHYCLLPRR